MKLNVHLRDELIDYETKFGKWKIQLTMQINFISSKDSGETCPWHTKSDNIKIMMGSETILLMNLLILFFKDIKKDQKSQREEEASFFFTVLIYCIIIFIKQV